MHTPGKLVHPILKALLIVPFIISSNQNQSIMRKIFIGLFIACLVACNTAEKTSPEEIKETTAAKVDMNMQGYSPSYSSSFEMGDPKNAETVLALWKDWDKGNLETSKMRFADSVSMFTSDGTVIAGTRDSALANVQNYRNMFSEIKSTVHAIFAVKSTDMNEDWVCIWGTEVNKLKSGKIDSVQLQETWRFDKAGKINLLYQHARVAKPQK